MWFKKKKKTNTIQVKGNGAYAPNSAEKAHFVRKFRKRRVRQRWLLLLFLVLPVATAGSFYWYRLQLFRDGAWQHPSVITVVILGMFMVAELAILAISLVNWRCSHCEHMAPFRPHPKRCRHCNAPLRASELSD